MSTVNEHENDENDDDDDSDNDNDNKILWKILSLFIKGGLADDC